ncbi:hypothetical protein ABB30_14520 [Stenotrophomonas ginsengisoli]|uniref:Immunity MXAN-0049 protein domain-containing protein n=1 Tax=Stenotrophomonas ginsengisoli TaxID=336566 RepID=A0A0R0D8X0_9GAMM|nr:DUF1629 domain-containing protein [Stenotrophomonas ginsengisoli]KRG74225.1 hypothetical protein ABB30_14520 [Stenotrophomonas ginsengisoli]
MNYYLLRQDMDIPDRWVLGAVRHVDNWLFRDPPVEFMEPGSYSVDVHFPGRQVDFSLAGYADVPVLSEKACDALCGLAEVDEPYRNVVFQRVEVVGAVSENNYFVMTIETQVDCIDQVQSSFERFASNDPVRPDLDGRYRVFTNLIIDSQRIGGHHIFRLSDYLRAIIVSEVVKERLEMAGVIGAKFDLVSSDAGTVF